MKSIKWSWPVTLFASPDLENVLRLSNSEVIKEYTRLFIPNDNVRGQTNRRNVQQKPIKVTIALIDTYELQSNFTADIVIFARKDTSNKSIGNRIFVNLLDKMMSNDQGAAIIVINQNVAEAFLEGIVRAIGSHGNFVEAVNRLAPIFSEFRYDLDWDNPIDKIYRDLSNRLEKLPQKQPIHFISGISNRKKFFPFQLKNEMDLYLSNSDQNFGLAFLKLVGDVVIRSERTSNTSTGSRGINKGYPREDNTISFQVPHSYFPNPDIKKENELSLEKNLRFLQCKVVSEVSGETEKEFLKPGESYFAKIRIGSGGIDYISADIIFQEQNMFEDEWVEEEDIYIHFEPEGSSTQQRMLKLPRHGNSESMEFRFYTAVDREFFKADIKAFHKNRLIQWAKFTATIGEVAEAHGKAMKLEVIDAPRRDLQDLSLRSTFGSSITVEEISSDLLISGINQNKPLRVNSSDGAKNTIDIIKGAVTSAAKDIAEFPENIHAESNQAIFRKLATQGYLLYTRLFKDSNITSPIQICSNKADFLPIGFAYELEAPSREAELCSKAADSLRSGKCGDCYDKSESPAKHICPFGFWGLSRVIEFHKAPPEGINFGKGDFLITNEPKADRTSIKVFNKAIHGSVERMEVKTPGLRDKLFDKIKNYSSACSLAEDWKQWEELTGSEDPDTIVLIVHVEKDAELEIDKMEIGTNEFLLQTNLNKKHISQKANPLAIVIGCEVTDTDNQGFDLGSEFLLNGASIVITNFTKILGRHAAKIVERLMELFNERKGEVVNFGEIMLKVKQRLLAEGLIVSMALVSYGDADWKLKI